MDKRILRVGVSLALVVALAAIPAGWADAANGLTTYTITDDITITIPSTWEFSAEDLSEDGFEDYISMRLQADHDIYGELDSYFGLETGATSYGEALNHRTRWQSQYPDHQFSDVSYANLGAEQAATFIEEDPSKGWTTYYYFYVKGGSCAELYFGAPSMKMEAAKADQDFIRNSVTFGPKF